MLHFGLEILLQITDPFSVFTSTKKKIFPFELDFFGVPGSFQNPEWARRWPVWARAEVECLRAKDLLQTQFRNTIYDAMLKRGWRETEEMSGIYTGQSGLVNELTRAFKRVAESQPLPKFPRALQKRLK